jgi:hypothetical protein
MQKPRRMRTPAGAGRVGHTGNSTGPHLHFQLMGSADPLMAKGVPCAFAEYLIQRGGAAGASSARHPWPARAHPLGLIGRGAAVTHVADVRVGPAAGTHHDSA